jgi:hypothetical protein
VDSPVAGIYSGEISAASKAPIYNAAFGSVPSSKLKGTNEKSN